MEKVIEKRKYEPGYVVEEGEERGEEEVVEGDQERLQEVVGGRSEQAAGQYSQ